MELGWTPGDCLGIPRPGPDLHQAAGGEPGLRGPGGAPAAGVHGGGLLQQAAQGDHQVVQAGVGVGTVREAPPAARG